MINRYRRYHNSYLSHFRLDEENDLAADNRHELLHPFSRVTLLQLPGLLLVGRAASMWNRRSRWAVVYGRNRNRSISTKARLWTFVQLASELKREH